MCTETVLNKHGAEGPRQGNMPRGDLLGSSPAKLVSVWAWAMPRLQMPSQLRGPCVRLGEDVPETALWWANGDHPDLASACFSRYPSWALNFCTRMASVSLYTIGGPESPTSHSSVFIGHFKSIGDCSTSSCEVRNTGQLLQSVLYYIFM